MGKRGAALIFAFLVIMVLTILSVGFLIKSVNNNRLTIRNVASIQAFWAAEAGVAQAVRYLPTQYSASPLTGYLDTPLTPNKFHYSVSSTFHSSHPDPIDPSKTITNYKIDATGSVTNTTVTRDIQAFVAFTPPSPGGFTSAIEVKNLLKIKGNSVISGPPYTDAQNFNDPAKYAKEGSNFTFQDKFDISEAEVKAYAQSQGTYFENPSSPLPNYQNGIYWVKIIAPTKQLKIPKTGWQGNNIILIVEGDCDMEGGDFDGILWVMGDLTISGNPDINGAVLSEQEIGITSVTGNPDIYYDPAVINTVLGPSGPFGGLGTRAIVAWREK